MAKSCFVECINKGKNYDPRIRKECANQLRLILAQENRIDLNLEKMAESFRYRNRDFIFLVNNNARMKQYKAQEILQMIMHEKEDAIEKLDRVSLIKFSKRLRRIFSLV